MTLPVEVTRFVVAGATEINAGLSPLVRAAQHPASLQRLLHQAGWDVDGLLSAEHSDAVVTAINAFQTSVSEVLAGPLEVSEVIDVGAALASSAVAFLGAATALEPVIEAALAEAISGGDQSNVHELAVHLVKDVGDILFIRWLQQASPTFYGLARVAGIVTIVRRPALYLDPPPLMPDSDGDGVPDPQLPVRWAMRRPGLNVEGLAQPLVLGLTSFLEDLPPDAYRSPAAFIAGVQFVLATRIDEMLGDLASRPIGVVSVSIDGDGVGFSAQNWLPTAQGPWSNDITFPLPTFAGTNGGDGSDDGNGGSEAVPWEVVVGRETWSLVWDSGNDVDELPLIGDVLVLVDRFVTPGLPADLKPHVLLEIDATDVGAIGVTVELLLGFRLNVVEGSPAEIALTARAVWDDGLDVAFRAEVLDTLEIPIFVPGLTGLALGLVKPSIELSAADLDTDPRLDLEVSVDGFELHLPAPFFRKAIQENGVWQIAEEGAPKVGFTLSTSGSADMPPVLLLGVASVDADDGSATGPVGLAVDRLELLPVGDDWTITVAADAMFIGLGDDINTGVIIEIQPTSYSAAPGGLGEISISQARVVLPPDLPAPLEEILITDATIDDGGFSGDVALVFDEPPPGQDPEKLFGALDISFRSISLVIEDNLPTEFAVEASVLMPYFDEWVDVTIGFDDEFNLSFLVESVDPDGITMTKEELLLLNFKSAFFEWRSEQRSVALELSGGIEPLLWGGDGLEWPRLDVTKLRVEQDIGSIIDGDPEPPVIRFEEAWLDLKELATLDLFGFHFELNRIGIGYVEATDELWIDLTGSLRLIELLPIGLGVEGFRVTWPRRIYEELEFDQLDELSIDQMLELASRIQVRFDGVYLFYGIPQAVEFEGYIRFIKTAQKVGFAGDVALRVPTSGLAIEAGLMVGMNFAEPAPYPFLYVYFGILLPSGIPLGQSGLALKGAKGLFGLNVEPDREPEQNPYYDWYKRGPIEGAHPTNKWRDRIWSIAFGAGITITTTDGKILGVQGLLALAIPGPIIFVEGKALIFDGVFPGDSPLKALGYFDGHELTTQLNIEASMELVEGVVDVMAGVEAFFDFRNIFNWHLYVGVDEPLDRRVHANFVKLPAIGWLFRADAYLMIDMPAADDLADTPITDIELADLTIQARTGVHIGFEPPKIDLVVASAEVHAVIEGEGLLTINPFLFNGSVGLDALIDIDAFGLVGISAEAAATMSIEGALPLIVDADIYARVDLPVPDLDAVPLVGDALSSALDWFEETVVDLPEIPDYLEVEIPFHWELDAPPLLDSLVVGVSVEPRFAQGGIDALRVPSPLPGVPVSPTADVDIAAAPVIALDARPVISFDQNVNVAEHLEFGGFSSGGGERFFAGKLAFRPTLRSVRIFELPNHLFVDGVSEDWMEVASTELAADSGVDDLWGMFRPAGEFTNEARAARRVLEVWAANPFEFLTGSIPLSIPGDTATSGGTIDPLDSLAIDDVPWCDDAEARMRCVGDDDIKEAAQSGESIIRAVPHRNSWRHGMRLRGVRFLAPDIRLSPVAGRHVIELDASDRRSLFAEVAFPERVVEATIRLLGKAGDGFGFRRVLSARHDSGLVTTPLGESPERVEDGETTLLEFSDPDGLDFVRLTGRDTLRIVEVCWTTVEEHEAAQVRQRSCAANAAVAARAIDPGVVLSANAHYRVEVETSIVLDEAGSEGAALALASLPGFSGAIQPYRVGQGGPFVATDTFHFRTDGPPSDLRPYVKWLSPSEGSDGHFTEDDLAIRFNRPYVHRLFPDPDNGAAGADEAGDSPYALEAFVEDAEGRVRRDWFLNWTTAASSTLAPEEQHWFDDIAPLSAPGVVPPPDDVLEIRRRLDVRNFGDVGTWVATSSKSVGGPPLPRRRRAQWKPVGNAMVTATLHGSRETHLYAAAGRTWGDSVIGVDVASTDLAGGVGVVSRFVDARHHYQVRVVGGVVEIVRVSGGVEKVLASEHLPGTLRPDRPTSLIRRDPVGRPPIISGRRPRPSIRGGSMRFSVRTEREASGVRLSCRLGRTNVSVFDAVPVADEGSVGVLAAGTDAVFKSFTAGSVEGPLDPSTRYQVTLAGGAGGRLVHEDRFGVGPAAFWVGSTGWTSVDDGIRAVGSASALSYGNPFDDGEFSMRVDLAGGQSCSIGLRVPDDRRADGNTARYDVEVARSGSSVTASLTVRTSLGDGGVVLAAGDTIVGAEVSIDVRVRLLGDRVRVWIFDRELIDTVLESPPAHRIRQGSLDVRAIVGTPTLREVQLREVALLRFGFTTRPDASFADVLDAVSDVDVEASSTAGAHSVPRAAIAAAVATQRAWADAEIDLLATSRRFAMRRAGREAVEASRQHALAVRADHDGAVADLLATIGAGPLVVPTEPSVREVSLGSGAIVGWIVRSPAPLDPASIASSPDIPLDGIGRTRFELVDAEGSTLPTHWVASSDGTTIVVYGVAAGVIPGPTSSAANLRSVFLDDRPSSIRVVRTRDHGDDSADVDHLLDRSYELAGGSRSPVTGLIVLS